MYLSDSPSRRLPAAIPRRLAITALAVLAVAATLVTPISGSAAGAASATSGPAAAAAAAGWLAARVTADGYVPDALGDPSPGDTLQTSLALATAGVGYDAFHRTLVWLGANVDAVTGTGTSADPGQIAYLLIVIDAAGGDATNFGGVDLVARLDSTLGGFEPGLFGGADPTYDGVFRQSLAIIGLEAVGETPPVEATNWLIAQQCGTSDPNVRGGWEAYRLVADACTAGSTATFTGVDTNSTAIATTALAAIDREPTYGTQPWFVAVQNSTGGWGYLQGLDDDPNSDALVIQAITATGASATATPFVLPGGDPLASLLSFQLGADADPADQGAFTFPGSDGAPNVLATEQATWGAMPRAFPLGLVAFSDAPVATTTTTAPGATPAAAVETTSHFTG